MQPVLGIDRRCLSVSLCLCLTSVIVLAAPPDLSHDHVDLTRNDQWLRALPEPAQRGYRHLLDSAYLPPDLDEDVFSQLIQKNLGMAALIEGGDVPAGFSKERAAAFLRYGLTDRPGDDSHKPLQYVVDSSQRWIMNCFACHGGTVYGRTQPGAPNNLYQLQTFTEDVRASKLRMAKALTHMDIGSIFMPLGSTVGRTNAVMFGVALMNFRDADLNVHSFRPAPRMVHHDMDPPAWWHFHRKQRLYIDGFAEKGVRGLMQFMLVRENGPDEFHRWESDFKDVYAFIDSVRPPKYPWPIDQVLAKRGQQAFNDHCAHCHGTYADGKSVFQSHFPERLIPIEEIGTDRVRLDSLSPQRRKSYGDSWFAYYGQQQTWLDPGGYMAPPLDGIWASAPYFHNGSVPTLWDVLHPLDRPIVWRRTHVNLDAKRVGLTVDNFESIPKATSTRDQREYFDTRGIGKSNRGHGFPDQLTEQQKVEVLEYLKSL